MRYTINRIEHDKRLSNYSCYTYNIYDNKAKKNILKKEYDLIIDIIEDKYAIVGNAIVSLEHDGWYKSYLFGLVNMEGEKITEIKYRAIYPYDNIIYCKLNWGPVNKLSFNNKYIWQNGKESFESEVPLTYVTDKGAIIVEGDEEKTIIKLLNNKGIIVDEIEYYEESKDFSIDFRQVVNNLINSSEGFIWCPLLQKPIHKKWNKINYRIELSNKEDEFYNYHNFCNITLNDGTIIKNIRFYIRNNNFLILKSNDYEDELFMILNSNFEIIFNEFYDYRGSNTIGDKLILYTRKGYMLLYENGEKFYLLEKFLLNHNGKKYSVDKYYCSFEYIDGNDYIRYKDYDNIGYINLYGEIVIPAIFPEGYMVESKGDRYVNDILKESYEAFEDAFEGDYDALWNID